MRKLIILGALAGAAGLKGSPFDSVPMREPVPEQRPEPMSQTYDEHERPSRKGLAAREKRKGGMRGLNRGPADFNRRPR